MTCLNLKTCCDLGYHSEAQQADPGQTHYGLDCDAQKLPLSDWCLPCQYKKAL